ncbi:MAG: hypothetical protein LBS19_07655 [Clostridiales bacterium]|jgi:hypothetical protein|nr:hypothetical protein [Clostridiales bacterium]
MRRLSKKIIFYITAFAIGFGALNYYFIPPVRVYAAESGTLEMERSMTAGTTAGPALPDDSTVENALNLTMTLDDDVLGDYIIIPFDTGRVIRADFIKGPPSVTPQLHVDFNIYPSVAAAKAGTGAVAEAFADPYYQLWRPDAGGSWVARDNVSPAALAPGIVLDEDAAGDRYDNPRFTITLADGFSTFGGLSLRYLNNYDVHIRWDHSDNEDTVRLSLNRLAKGRVYTAWFGDLPNIAGLDPADFAANTANGVITKYGFNGINMSTFKAVPYAKDYPHDNDYRYEKDAGIAEWYGNDDNHYLLHYDEEQNPETGAYDNSYMDLGPELDPAQPSTSALENRVEISFELPKSWDDADGGFTREMSEVSEDEYDMTIRFLLERNIQAGGRYNPGTTVVIDRIGANGAYDVVNPGDDYTIDYTQGEGAAVVADPKEQEGPANEGFSVAGNVVKFTITDTRSGGNDVPLPASTMFNECQIAVVGPDDPSANPNDPKIDNAENQAVPPNIVYTYASYTGPLYINDGYYLTIDAYREFNSQSTASPNYVDGFFGIIDSFSANNPNDVNGEITVEFDKEVNTTGRVTLPVPASEINENSTQAIYERIYFRQGTESDRLWQQKLRVKPSLFDIKIGAPRNFRYYYEPHKMDPTWPPGTDSGADTGVAVPYSDVTLYLAWDIATYGVIQDLLEMSPDGTLDVDFDLMKSEQPVTGGSSEAFASLGVRFTWVKDGDAGAGTVTAEIVRTSDEILEFEIGTKMMPPRWRKDENGNIFAIEAGATERPVLRNDPVGIQVDVKVGAEHGELAGTEFSQGFKFTYPNIYFLHAVAKTSQQVIGGASNIRDLTLDDYGVSAIMPPQNIEIFSDWTAEDAPEPVSAKLRFRAPYKALRDYVQDRQSLDPALKDAVPITTFTLVITQDESKILQFNDGLNDWNEAGTGVPLTAAADPIPGLPLYFYSSERVLGDNEFNIAEVPGDGRAPSILSALRSNDGIVGIVDFPRLHNEIYVDGGGSPVSDASLIAGLDRDYPSDSIESFYEILGLDKNQQYYTAMFTTVTFFWPGNAEQEIIREYYSQLTGIRAFTTANDLMPVDPNEERPDGPVFLPPREEDPEAGIEGDVKDFEVRLRWEDVERPEERDGYYIDYEIIRTAAQIDPLRLTDNLGAFPNFFNNADFIDPRDSTRTAFRWHRGSGITERYDPRGGAWGRDANVNIGPEEDGLFYLTDRTVTPNSIYFYYIRAVKKLRVSGEEVGYSPWSGISVTTKQIQKPQNLEVLLDESIYEYDLKTEAIIRFEAYVPNLGALHNSTFLDLSVRKGMEEWSEAEQMMPGGFLEIQPAEREGWHIFTYRVMGLEPSADYAFRVRLRMVSEVLITDENGNEQRMVQSSEWSDPAYTRTEYDNEANEQQHDIDSWIKFLREDVWAELRGLYWPVNLSGSQATLLYRPSMMNMLFNTPDSQVYLYNQFERPASRLTVYLPAGIVRQADIAYKSFIIRNGALETVIPMNTLTEDIAGISDALGDIKAHNAEDYYIRLTLDYQVYTGSVDNYDLAERFCVIRAEAVSATVSAQATDSGIRGLVEGKLGEEGFFDAPEAQLKAMMDQQRDQQEIAAYIYGFASSVVSSLMTQANADLAASLRQAWNIPEFNGPFLHGLINNDLQAVILGYFSDGGAYYPVDTVNYKGGQAVRVFNQGQVLFTIHGAMSGVPGLAEGVEYPGGMAEVITKYGLSDILDGGASLNVTAGLGSAMGIIARVAGAAGGEDGVGWMRENGYSIAGKTAASYLTYQESAYLLMGLYEIQTGTGANAVRIRDYTVTAAIPGIDDKYLQSVRAAFELGVFTDPGLKPKDNVSVMALLDMISRLNAKMGL